MDIYFFLRRRLNFISTLYEQSTAHFIETKRRIEAGEEPFVDYSNPEHNDGTPAFLEDWQQADESIESLGRWSVLQLSSALKGYLGTFAADMAAYYGHEFPEFADYKKELAALTKRYGWLLGYQALFLNLYKIDWARGQNLIAGLEHLVLTRNDLEHKVDLISRYVIQDHKHREKHYDGLFVDTEIQFWDNASNALSVNKDRLKKAIEHVDLSCRWLESLRVSYPRFRKHGNYEQIFLDSAPVYSDDTF